MTARAPPPTGRPAARVLHVVSNMDRGGAETMLMNYYRRVDRERVQFDFLVHSDREGHFDQEIRGLGGRVFRVQSPGSAGPVRYIGAVRALLRREGPFRAVHTHTDSSGAFSVLAARIAGVRRRIVHSHNTAPRRQSPRATVAVEEAMLKVAIHAFATDRCACGAAAAAYLFGSCVAEDAGAVRILPNAIDSEVFRLAWRLDRAAIRESIGISADAKVLLCVANFVPAKNHAFLLQVAAALKAEGHPMSLLLVGDGPLRAEIEGRIAALRIGEHVRLLGVRGDVPNLLRAADGFVMASHFEGLPLALIEAQAAGLPCLVSENVTTEADLALGLITRLPLDAPIAEWIGAVRRLTRERPTLTFDQVQVAMMARGYDAATNVVHLYRLYGVPESQRAVS